MIEFNTDLDELKAYVKENGVENVWGLCHE